MNKNFSRTITSSSTENVKRSFWQWLVDPVTMITEAGERRQARLVSSILLVVMLAMSFGVAANTFIINGPVAARILAGSVFVLGVAYILTRTRHYRLGVPLLLAVTALYSILSVIIGNNYSSEGLLTIFIFNILAILLSSTLASFRTTIFLSAANFLSLLLIPLFIPAILYGNMVMPLIFNGVVSVVILVLTRHRNQVEKDHLSEEDKINNALQASNATLQTSIAALDARTRDLNLAIEVGRSVSQVRALDVMLTDAAELIRKQFDLYYVQVYLTNPSQTVLILQSGTGTVGEELLQRSHQLPLNTASINGRAAIEKKSVVISDTKSSSTFKPNPLLPDTRSEMAVPLMIGERVVGVLDMQSEQSGSLSQDILPAFEALAGQLAIAIQNANFLAETQQARAEVEAQARRLSRANWVDYLDAIHKPEEIGFVFEQNKIAPMPSDEQSQSKTNDNALTAPITVTGEFLGNLVVEMEGQSPISRTSELVNTVARQVAQQIESLRLLDSAERYRAEAEEASRRITHEGWKDYMNANTSEGISYIYDLKEVRPFDQVEGQQAESSGFSLPLKVHDETVGRLVVHGFEAGDSEALELTNAVAERLGSHIESLRLSKQTEQALATTQKLAEREQALRQITSAVRSSTDPATILRSAARELGTLLGRRTIVRLTTARETQPNQQHLSADIAESPIADGDDK